ncbi:MAG TPA: hypothetical protein VMT04_00050 [Terriglobales bacterium]|nr:hypothetical protein [Terriglobales bacterium]
MSNFEIIINSEKILLKAFDILHDAACYENDIKYDSKTEALDIIFEREFFEDPSKINTRPALLIFEKVEFPIVKSNLHLEGLDFYRIHSKDKSLKTHSFNECKIKPNRFLLYFNEVLEIEIGFKSSIIGSLKDIEFVEGKKVSSIQFRGISLFSYRTY